MKPQEKAKQLVDLFYQLFPLDKDVITTDGELNWEYNDWNQSKKSALIAVNEIFDIGLLGGDYRNEQSTIDDFSTVTWYFNYWEEVKHEIEQL